MTKISLANDTLVELSDADPFTVAPFVEKFCEEFEKFNKEAFRHAISIAKTFNGKTAVYKLQEEIEKFNKEASKHALCAAESIKGRLFVVDESQAELEKFNKEPSKHAPFDGKAVVNTFQVEFERIKEHASKIALNVSHAMSNNPCLHIDYSKSETDLEESRDATECTGRRDDDQAEALPAKNVAELERIKAEATKVTLTSESRHKTFATRSFLDGRFADNPNLWKLDFEFVESFPLADLETMEIHVGGNFFVKINNETSEGYVEENNAGEVTLCIDDRVWITLSLSRYQSKDIGTLRDVDSNNVLDALIALISTDIRFVVEDVQFFSESIPGLMSYVTLDGESERERIEALKAHTFLGGIISIMQANGSTDDLKLLVPKATEILDALLEVGLDDASERVEELVPLMMTAQDTGVEELAVVARKHVNTTR